MNSKRISENGNKVTFLLAESRLHAKELIQDSELFSLPDGGHLKLGHFSAIRKKTGDFITLNAR